MNARRLPPAFLLALLAVALDAGAQSQNAVDKFWVTDGGVAAVTEDFTKVYVGGKFTRVAQRSGSSVRIDAATGAADTPFPEVRGVVNAVVPDGAGGWFLGGSFDRVGDRFRNNVAHVLADGRVADWESNVNGPVFALAREPGWLYVGGSFTSVTGFPRNNLARVDTAFGSGDPTWDPNVGGAEVRALVLRQGVLYIGGTFTTINGGTPRNNAAAVATATGLVTPWNPNVNGPVRALAVPTSTGFTDVYLGGTFTTVNGGIPYARAAMVNAAGILNPSWIANVNGPVNAIAVPGGGGVVYVGGAFTNIGGQPRANIAALDAAGNAIAGWNPGADATVNALAMDGFDLYLGGDFKQVAGQPRHHLALVDDPGGVLQPWDPHAFGPVAALAFSDRPTGPDWVYAGGAFSAINGAPRSNLAAFTKATGAVDPSWTPEPDGGVHALKQLSSIIYAGGEFAVIGGQTRRRLAAVNNTNGQATGWNPDVTAGAGAPSVRAMSFDVGGNRVYVGGEFTLANGTAPRLNAAAFDLATAAVLAWDPGPTAMVRDIEVVPGVKVDLAGDFVQLNNPLLTEEYFATVDATLGVNVPLSGNPNAPVHGFFSQGGNVHLGGAFSLIGTLPVTRNRAGAVTALGLATGWDPNVGGPLVRALVQDGGTTAVLGGDFGTIGALPRNNLAQVDLTAGVPTPWNPDANGGHVFTVLPTPPMLFAGGEFRFVSGRPQRSFAAFCKATVVTGVTASPAGPNSIQVNWTDTGVPSYNVYRSENALPWQFVGSASSGGVGLIDFDAEGGVTYGYAVRAEQGQCESDLSTPTAYASTTGACGAAPFFDGAADAVQAPGSACQVQVLWRGALGRCGESPVFSVYRSVNPAFVPNADTRFAQGISGYGWLDSTDLAPGGTYYYVVRAFDPGNGEEDQNEIRVPITLSPGCTGGTPPPVDVITTRARGGENRVEWVYPLGFSSVVLRYNASGAPDTPCVTPTDPTDGTAVPGSPFAGTPGTAGFVNHVVGGSSNGRNFCYAAFVIGLTPSENFPVQARPAAAPAAVRWSYTTGASALSRPAVMPERASFGVSNDRRLHAMRSGPTGGAWPTTPSQWLPQSLDAASLGRPTVVEMTTTQVGGTRRIAVVGAQDGRVYCFAADTGALLWIANGGVPLGDGIVTPPTIMVTDFGAAPANLVFVGTRNATSDNRLVALNLSTGSLAWSFDNGGGPQGIGIISGQPLIEYGATPRVYFTSRRRAGGSSNTVWALSVTASSGTLAWPAVNAGEIDGAPTRRGAALYVGTNNGDVFSFSAASGTLNWSTNLADGAIKGFVWPDASPSNRLYVSTTNKVHALSDNGGSVTSFWSAPLSLPSPSTPLVLSNVLYVGAGDGRLYRAPSNIPGTPPVPTSVLLGDPTVPKTVGTPAFDRASPTTTLDDTVVVGTDEGRFYAVAVNPPF